MQQLAQLTGHIHQYTFFENVVYHTKDYDGYVGERHYRNDGYTDNSVDCKTSEAARAYVAEKAGEHLANGEVSDFRRLQLDKYGYSPAGNFLAAKYDDILVVLDATTLQIIHSTDFNRRKFGHHVQALADGRLLCLLGEGELLLIETKTWQIAFQKKASDKLYKMNLSASGKKLMLEGYPNCNILDIENKPRLILKTDPKQKIGDLFFIDENIVCGFDYKNGQTSFYDISSGNLVPLSSRLPFRIINPIFYNGSLFSMPFNGSGSPTEVAQINLKNFTWVYKGLFGGQAKCYLGKFVSYPEPGTVVYAIQDSTSGTYYTSFFKYNLEFNTLTEMKTMEGKFILLGFYDTQTALVLNNETPGKIRL
ncbi:MAG TPA: hypothetical protein VG603_03605 [Chitinophagales bacterium]|nr:hypothetical protein [Chitinophagales bacterium]